ncbi:MAG: hypothetical protein NTY48_01265 [Candidatus Diapherotrites archaeon]|nr:hypothetical protein [Candidatus Diapherotrites archaeon]
MFLKGLYSFKKSGAVASKNDSCAQSTVETLLVLAIGIFILVSLVAIVYNQIDNGVVLQQQKIGANTIRTLAKEIDDAYYLGPGTVRNISLTLPSSTDLNRSFISGRAIVLNVAGSDLLAGTSVRVVGAWPNTNGSHVFSITVFSDFVAVSTQSLSFSPAFVSKTISQSSSFVAVVVLSNSTSSTASYNIALDFPSSGSETLVSIIGGSSISVLSNNNSNLTFSLSCAANSFGYYDGNVVLSPISGKDANLLIPIRLVCSEAQPKLSLFPAVKPISVSASARTADSVLACNNTASVFSHSSILVSGEVAKYVYASFSSDINANSCITIPLTISSPSQAGLYNGIIKIYSSGYSASSDVNLSVS